MTGTGHAVRRAESRRQVRHNRITDRDLVVAIVTLLSALGGALADVRPTAWRPADVVLTAALTAFVAWAGASAPWWVLAFASVVAAALVAPSTPLVIAAAVAFVISIVIGARRARLPVGRSVAAALVINVLLRWTGPDVFGLSAAVTAVVVAVIVVTGLARRGRAQRRIVRRVLLGGAAIGGLVVVGAAIALGQAYGDLRDGEAAMRDAAEELRSGDVAAAAESLERSSTLLAAASSALERPWARPALAVPVLGQHVGAVADLADGAESLTDQAATSVAQIDVDALRVVDGVIDLPAIQVLETPFAATNESLRRLADVVQQTRSPWLVAPIGERIGELGAEVDELVDETGRALDAVRLAPSMLGAEGPRTYFVAFTTPAELRGLGGSMGTWAELRADGGRLEVVAAGLTQDLIGAMRNNPPVLEGPPDYLARYGRFGAGLDGSPVAIDFWSNVTISPDFPSVAEVIGQLYPESGGTEIAGAIVVDVDALARFLELVGPITIDGDAGPIRVDANNARDYLLRDQYVDIADDSVRDTALEQLTTLLVDRVFGGTLPGPRVLADTVGPVFGEGRIAVWSFDPDDQVLLRELGIAGELPAPSPDGLAVVSTNAGANKLDAYLRRTIDYEVLLDEPTGDLRATATITLANDAPDGLSRYAGGNPFGLPTGTNRQYLSVYSPWQFGLAEVDGRSTGVEVERELGWNVYSTYVDIPPGESVEVRLGFVGELPAGAEYGLTLRSQPMVAPDTVRIHVTATSGETIIESQQSRVGVDTLRAFPPDGG